MPEEEKWKQATTWSQLLIEEKSLSVLSIGSVFTKSILILCIDEVFTNVIHIFV